MPIRVLAVDLEGTLISNAVHPLPRPKLREFLDFCRPRFEEVVIMTAVPQWREQEIVGEFVIQKIVPGWFFNARYISWREPYKDLRYVRTAAVDEILLLDDDWTVVHPDQLDQHIFLRSWLRPYDPDDRELDSIVGVIQSQWME